MTHSVHEITINKEKHNCNLSGLRSPFLYAGGQEFRKDGLSLFQHVWGLVWECWKAGGDSTAECIILNLRTMRVAALQNSFGNFNNVS